MDRWFGTTVGDIRETDPGTFRDRVTGHLSKVLSYRQIRQEQQEAWVWTAAAVHGWVQSAAALPDHCLVLFEYAPPLFTKRSDVLIVTDCFVLVFELKTGRAAPLKAASRQALDYGKDIYWFHPGARGRTVIPLVIRDKGRGNPVGLPAPDALPQKALELSAADIPTLLMDVLSRENAPGPAVEQEMWLHAQYAPRPGIVDAAVALVARTEDPGINAALSDDEELNRLTKLLVDEVDEAAVKGQHRLVLVTGVPGAGKTLVGLRLAHDPSVVERLRSLGSEVPLYLTGNAALVAVLSEALAQDHHRRHPAGTLDASRTRSATLVKLVHAFTREALTNPGHLQVPRVAVFDEGQRAWDHGRMAKEHQSLGSRGQSEPEVILQGLESKDWGVVVVLVGVGQEINHGEPGAELWVQAAQGRPAAGGKPWHVAGPPGFVPQNRSGATATSSLHLRETRRSLGALWLAEWVEDVLANRPAAAMERIRASDFPLVLTRSLDEARAWLRRRGQHRRFGLVASARAGRLRPYGIEMDAGLQGGINWPRWFLDRPPSLQSSTMLEVAASEFKCQGLEIDLVGLCWSWDMIREGGAVAAPAPRR